MTAPPTWSDWIPRMAGVQPYADWWKATNRLDAADLAPDGVALVSLRIKGLEKNGDAPDIADVALDIAEEDYGGGACAPLPAIARNLDWNGVWITDEFRDRLPTDTPEDAVILGVIDTGTPLSHLRTRMLGEDGALRTRILSAWQQSATWAGGRSGRRDYLPFGRELLADEIDDMINAAALPATGAVDEEAFNRAAHLVEPERLRGHRDLDFRAAHGAHILDLAAGIDPFGAACDLARRLRIIVVNLPPQYLHGTAGDFLNYYAAFAVERIVAVADAIWDKTHGAGAGGAKAAAPAAARKGFPIAINFSYGMQAGPRDESGAFARALSRVVDARRNKGPEAAPIRIAMPVGNNNLEQGAARLQLATGAPAALNWRISPGDATSNFVEIWTDPVPDDDPAGPLTAAAFSLSVIPPGGAAPAPAPRPGAHATLGDFARVYCEETSVTKDGAPHKRLYFLIAAAPTLRYGPRTPMGPAPAGLWRLEITSHARDIDVDLHIQSDQAEVIQGQTGLKSYFDDPDYRVFEDDGSVRDSFAYPYVSERRSGREAGQGPVRRAGTENAMAASRHIAMIGGYRLSDGRPALYASTGAPAGAAFGALRRPDVAFPTEDGAAHPGVLASGAKDGSAVWFRGASMAAAQATRTTAAGMIEWLDHWTAHGATFDGAWLFAQGRAAEAVSPHPGPAAPAKVGGGRAPWPSGLQPLRLTGGRLYEP